MTLTLPASPWLIPTIIHASARFSFAPTSRHKKYIFLLLEKISSLAFIMFYCIESRAESSRGNKRLKWLIITWEEKKRSLRSMRNTEIPSSLECVSDVGLLQDTRTIGEGKKKSWKKFWIIWIFSISLRARLSSCPQHHIYYHHPIPPRLYTFYIRCCFLFSHCDKRISRVCRIVLRVR